MFVEAYFKQRDLILSRWGRGSDLNAYILLFGGEFNTLATSSRQT